MSKVEKHHLILMGNCRRLHGIKGEFVFNLINKESSILKSGMDLSILSLTDNKIRDEKKFKLSNVRFGNKVIAKIDGIDDRETAEKLVPFEIYVNRELFSKLNESEFYLNDLIGFEVINKDSNISIGTIDRYYHNGEYDIAVIRHKNGEDLDIPLIKPFISEINLKEKTVEMMMLEGEQSE